MINRRAFFRTAMTASAGIVCGASAAKAIAFDPEPPVDLSQLYHTAKAACSSGTNAYHQQLLADGEALLTAEHATAEQRRQWLATATCPICGCRIASS